MTKGKRCETLTVFSPPVPLLVHTNKQIDPVIEIKISVTSNPPLPDVPVELYRSAANLILA